MGQQIGIMNFADNLTPEELSSNYVRGRQRPRAMMPLPYSKKNSQPCKCVSKGERASVKNCSAHRNEEMFSLSMVSNDLINVPAQPISPTLLDYKVDSKDNEKNGQT